LDPKGKKWREAGRDCIMRGFIFILHKIISGWSKEGVWHVGEMRNAHRILIRNPLGKPTRRWENNIKIYLKQTGHKWLDWMRQIQDRI
jgi:hypothetical protein